MLEKIKKLKNQALKEIKKSKVLKELQALETKYLGRKGELTGILRNLKDLAKEQKPLVGKLANEVKSEIEQAVSDLKFELTRPGQNPGKQFFYFLEGLVFKFFYLFQHKYRS